MYSSYLEFFDRQITMHGSQHTLQHFFYNSPLAHSIGSQRLPMVHLALGLKYALPEIIGQGLSYIATSYQDTRFLLEELYSNGHLTAHEILIEQVKVDPRFGSSPTTIGCVQHQNTKVAYQNILKSTKELLRNYVYLWRVPNHTSDALNELRILAAHMMMSPMKSGLLKYHVDLGTSGNLLKTINAMDILYPNGTCPIELVRVQFLNIICSYILQGRPNIMSYTNHTKQSNIFRSVIQKVLDKEDVNVKTISALSTLEEAEEKEEDMIFNKVMSCF